MATITGFTAERMLVIENETVVDGEVQGDNLHLIRRDGIVIDAGNVRGPKGDVGPGGLGVPPGGNAGQILTKNSSTDNDSSWKESDSPGIIKMTAAITIPNGWHLCDGTALDRILYAGLFAAIGTTYGLGDGVSTFNIPNITKRFPYGDILPGAIGGADNHLHHSNHSHVLNDSAQAQLSIGAVTNTWLNARCLGGAAYTAGYGSTTGGGGGSGTPAQTRTTAVTGSTTATNVASDTIDHKPPYIALLFIIKL